MLARSAWPGAGENANVRPLNRIDFRRSILAHGSKSIDVLAPHSQFYQGRFGRIAPDLPAWTPPGVPESGIDAFFLDVANTLMTEVPGADPADLLTMTPELEAEFQTGVVSDTATGIPAGYTYFGQFVDHDITFDTASSLQRKSDPEGILNFRTPRLDLDNVYGRGRSDQPYMYDGSTGKMLIGQIAGSTLSDLPRNAQGRALIGDMRNDENSMVSQLQLAMLRAHNTLVDRATAAGMDDPFEAARTTLRWLYQWVVWHDFVHRIANDEIHGAALSLETMPGGRKFWDLGLSDVYSWRNDPYMPVEFSVAAYRFGHSMVRNAYQTNFPHRGFGVFAPIFDNTGGGDPDDLRGFRPMKAENSIQWDWFLPMGGPGPFPQRARKIDTKLANALVNLHEDAAGSPMNILAFRNLKRGWSFGLPSGTDLAQKFGLTPIALGADEPDSLWYYILKEAGSLPGANGGQMLGRLGSTIVCGVFAGLLKGDPNSWVNIRPTWTPADDPLLQDGTDNADSPGKWELSSIIRLSGLPVAGGDF